MITARGVVGVMGVKPPDPESHLTPDQRNLLDAFGSLAALAVERAQLSEAARQAQLLQTTDALLLRLQAALLNSISHDLRTPLVSITGALSSLESDGDQLDAATKRSMIETARGEAERLNRLVSNLLDMTRLESGTMKVVKEPAEIQDAIGAALEQFSGRLGQRPVAVRLADTLPLVPMDFVLIVRVLVNVIDNALKYSPPDAPIEITARQTGGSVEIQVADRGLGIPADDLPRIFDKFYRVQRSGSIAGTGLGLSICKGMVEAHGGSIRAEGRPGGGTSVTLALPLADRSDSEGRDVV
jgi:two-component system sensor histidine kinase KdpD